MTLIEENLLVRKRYFYPFCHNLNIFVVTAQILDASEASLHSVQLFRVPGAAYLFPVRQSAYYLVNAARRVLKFLVAYIAAQDFADKFGSAYARPFLYAHGVQRIRFPQITAAVA